MSNAEERELMMELAEKGEYLKSMLAIKGSDLSEEEKSTMRTKVAETSCEVLRERGEYLEAYIAANVNNLDQKDEVKEEYAEDLIKRGGKTLEFEGMGDPKKYIMDSL